MALPPTVPPVLLPELLGFSPQLFLDDIVDEASDSVGKTVDAMDSFLERWADERAERVGSDWDRIQEVEQGLVAFQTLLEFHTDIAFDFFELWCRRNIFAIPADLPIVTPHQQGLNLDQPPEKENDLLAEIEELRRNIDNQRRLQRLYTRAVRLSNATARRAERRAQRVSFLSGPDMDLLSTLPAQTLELFQSISSLPEIDDTKLLVPDAGTGKREWEKSKAGYMNWAIGQLVQKSKEQMHAEGRTGEGSSAVNGAAAMAYGVARLKDVQDAFAVETGGQMSTEPDEDAMEVE